MHHCIVFNDVESGTQASDILSEFHNLQSRNAVTENSQKNLSFPGCTPYRYSKHAK